MESSMRRKEFDVQDEEEIRAFLAEMTFGFMGSRTDDYPHITPLNFVFANNVVYFHGSRVGQKMRDLAADPRVTFAVAREFAIIPSYFSEEGIACPATAFFKSVMIYGRAAEVTDLEEKKIALEAFMEKLQPEGGYRPFDLEDKEYYRNIKGVSVVKIVPEKMTAKFKFGQNQKEAKWNKVAASLEKRGTESDLETLENMKKRCPFH